MTLADAVLRSMLSLDDIGMRGPFRREALVRIIDREFVFADGDFGVVLTSDRAYTSIKMGNVQQTVRTSQLRGARADVMPWNAEGP